jgi:hypothetical protein
MSRLLLSQAFGKQSARTLCESLLALTLAASAYYLLHYVPKHVKAGEPVLALANYFLTYAPIQEANQPAFVLPDAAQVWDTPAEIRVQVATLRCGDEVQALGHFRDWTHVRTQAGEEGWISDDELMSATTHEAEELLREAIAETPAQAFGHSENVDNLHIDASRQAHVVAQVNPAQSLEIFGRRVLRRHYEDSPSGILPVSSDPLEAWYLVRQGSHIGWILGRHVQLDIPKGISAYAQETNLVAWLALDTVDDDGQKIPQYLVADRAGSETCDFTDIRVLTWWKKKQTYAIAYQEKGLRGYFPILVTHKGSVPYFRLWLVDEQGAKGQKVYGLFDTITRVIGFEGNPQSDFVAESSRSGRELAITRGYGDLTHKSALLPAVAATPILSPEQRRRDSAER